MTRKSHPQVVTWQAPSGQTVDVCPNCETKMKKAGQWPHTQAGEEFCQVQHGKHNGLCDLCDAQSDRDWNIW